MAKWPLGQAQHCPSSPSRRATLAFGGCQSLLWLSAYPLLRDFKLEHSGLSASCLLLVYLNEMSWEGKVKWTCEWSPHTLTLLLLVPHPTVSGFLTRILRDLTLCYWLSFKIADPWDSAYFQQTASGQKVYMNWQIEVKYLYLIENIYNLGFGLQHVFRSLCRQVMEGSLLLLLAQGNKAKILTTAVFLDVYTLPPHFTPSTWQFCICFVDFHALL